MSNISICYSQIPTTFEVNNHVVAEVVKRKRFSFTRAKNYLLARVASPKEHPVQLLSFKNLETGTVFISKPKVSHTDQPALKATSRLRRGFLRNASVRLSQLSHKIKKTSIAHETTNQSEMNVVENMLLTSATQAREHLNNIISEVNSLIENKGGLSTDDIKGFLREGVGSKANIRMVITGLSAFNLKQATSMLIMVEDEEFVRKFQADHAPLTAFGDVVHDLLERPLFSQSNAEAGNKVTFRTCGTSGNASFSALLRTAQEAGLSITDEEIGAAFVSRLKTVKAALDEHYPKIKQYLTD